jgi:hypothetical protein
MVKEITRRWKVDLQCANVLYHIDMKTWFRMPMINC